MFALQSDVVVCCWRLHNLHSPFLSVFPSKSFLPSFIRPKQITSLCFDNHGKRKILEVLPSPSFFVSLSLSGLLHFLPFPFTLTSISALTYHLPFLNVLSWSDPHSVLCDGEIWICTLIPDVEEIIHIHFVPPLKFWPSFGSCYKWIKHYYWILYFAHALTYLEESIYFLIPQSPLYLCFFVTLWTLTSIFPWLWNAKSPLKITYSIYGLFSTNVNLRLLRYFNSDFCCKCDLYICT